MPQLDSQTLARLDRAIAERVRAFGVTSSLVTSPASEPAAADQAIALHPLHIGSDVVATVRMATTLEMQKQLPTILNAAAQTADDVWCAEKGEQTLLQLTDRIEQAYEQAHLLFRLAKIPESPSEYGPALADAIERLLGITNLGWVALQFLDGPTTVAPLRGRQFLAGVVPAEADRFNALLAVAMGETRGNVIVRTDESELAALTGNEVLLQPLSFDGQRLGMLAAGNNGGDDPGLSSFETQLFAACAGYLNTFHANVARVAQQEAMFLGTLRALTASIDAKDPYTCGHSERVALLAHSVAIALGFSEEKAEQYRIAGLIHDVGKIGVPEAVLCKAGRLTDEEFSHIRKHPQIGFDILRDIPGLDELRLGVLHHHERYDGTGYPNRLEGEAIPHVARVLALADTFDAMSSNRSYRSKLPREHVLTELASCAGTQFDPALAAVFVKMDFTRFDEALRNHAEVFPTPITRAA